MNQQAHNPVLFPNSDLNIIHRQGRLLAAQMGKQSATAPITVGDVCVLAAYTGGASVSEATRRLTNGDLANALPSPLRPADMVNHARQLAGQGLLTDRAPSEQPAEVQTLADCPQDQKTGLPGKLRLSSNFCLTPGESGFQTRSARQQKYLTISLDLALLCIAFGSGRPATQVLRELAHLGEVGQLVAALGWLQQVGLLTRVLQNIPKAPTPSVPRELPSSKLPGWQSMQADGRIPVYFAPHMENHYPLALGMLFSAIAAWDDGALSDRFQLIPIAYLKPPQLFDGPYRKFGPGIWLFSNYMWSVDINLQISQGFKNHDAANLCIHGGPSTPGYKEACTEFMTRNPSVDIAVHGEGEVSICEVLDSIDIGDDRSFRVNDEKLRTVDGLTFRDHSGGLAWTPPRTRMREPDKIPSPYLDGVFDHYRGQVEAAIIESNRGCPFGCTFCDWGSATSQKVRKFDLERVKQEVDWIGQRGIRVLWIADANFGMYDRDIELAAHIVKTKAQFGYPSEVVVNYTKNTNRRLIEIIRIFSDGGIISQGIISIQTTDEKTLEVINRRNIKTEKYDELAKVFEEARLPLSTDLMIGLPGITRQAWDNDLQRYFDADVSVKAYPTQLLPNSPMADPEYRRKYQIETDENDFVVACHSFSQSDLVEMKAIYHAFEIAEGYGLLRYVMRYLQWDKGIKAIDFLHQLLNAVRANPAAYPSVTWVFRFFRSDKSTLGGWRRFYDEISGFIQQHYGLERDSAMDTALEVNEAAMPDDTLDYPRSMNLAHDFSAWFYLRRRSPSQVRALGDFPPAKFEVDDPDLMALIDMDYLQYDSHQYFWELQSPVARPKSVSDVKDRMSQKLRHSA